MATGISALRARVRAATGHDDALDRAIADALDGGGSDVGDPPGYTASVDQCIALIHRALPGWGWHVGYGPRGILPYASVTDADHSQRFEASAPTVPLALIAALIEARLGVEPG